MKKQAFTLIEMMVALFILSMASVVVGWQIHRMIREHSLESDAETLCIALQEAQLLAVTHQTDFRIHFFTEQNTPAYAIRTHEPLAVVDQRSKPFAAVKALTWQGKRVPSLELTVYASGRIEPVGVLGLIPSHLDRCTHWIDLQQPLSIRLERECPSVLKQKIPKEKL